MSLKLVLEHRRRNGRDQTHAVARSASAIPGATTARLVFWLMAICSKECLIPQTVPNNPMNVAVEPVVARKLRPRFRNSLSRRWPRSSPGRSGFAPRR